MTFALRRHVFLCALLSIGACRDETPAAAPPAVVAAPAETRPLAAAPPPVVHAPVRAAEVAAQPEPAPPEAPEAQAPPAVAASRAPAPAADFVRESEHYRATCHGIESGAADECLAAAEAGWAVVDALFPRTPANLRAKRLDLHLYDRFEDFRKADAVFGGGVFARDGLNFAMWGTRTAYVWVGLGGHAASGRAGSVTWGVRREVAHEAAHLAVADRLGYGWGRTAWLAEGLATYVEDLALERLGWTAGIAAEPLTCRRMVRCRALRRTGKLPTVRSLLTADLDATTCPQIDDRYAVYWAFFRFLMEPAQRERTQRLFARARKAPDGAAEFVTRRLLAFAEQEWTPRGLDALDEAFGAYVDGFAPEWDPQWGALSVSGARWIVTSQNGMAGSWRTAEAGRPAYRVTGTFAIDPLGGKGREIFLLLGRTTDAFVAVDFHAGSGVGVYEGRRGRSWDDVTWKTLGFENVHRPAAGTETAFEVEVDQDVIRVRMGAQDVLRTRLDGHDMTGAWGIGVSPDAVGVFDGVELR